MPTARDYLEETWWLGMTKAEEVRRLEARDAVWAAHVVELEAKLAEARAETTADAAPSETPSVKCKCCGKPSIHDGLYGDDWCDECLTDVSALGECSRNHSPAPTGKP